MLLKPRKTYAEIQGRIPVLLTAPHVEPPKAETLIEEIVTRVANESGAHALLGRISRTQLDLNRAEAMGSDFRKRLGELIQNKKIHWVLDIHGCAYAEGRPEIDLGTAGFQTLSEDAANRIQKHLLDAGFDARLDHYFKGKRSEGNIIQTCGVPAIQFEIRKDVRQNTEPRFRHLIKTLRDLVQDLAAHSLTK